jgi:hypothetical protein
MSSNVVKAGLILLASAGLLLLNLKGKKSADKLRNYFEKCSIRTGKAKFEPEKINFC